MRHPAIWLAAALTATGCGGVEYRDSTGAVDANPLCVSDPNQPNEPISDACRRAQEATWSSERESEPVDFGKDDD
jgi:hypothetical protein